MMWGGGGFAPFECPPLAMNIDNGQDYKLVVSFSIKAISY